MAHKVWKCIKCNMILENGLVYKDGICEKCHEKVIKVSPSQEDIIAHIKAVNSKCGNMSYDEELKKACNLFKLHEFALPYIPENYGSEDCPKVLHVGESNYIAGEKYDGPILKELFMNDWWDKKHAIIDLIEANPELCWDGNYTRYVLDSFGKGYSDYFDNYNIIGKTFLRLNGNEEPDEKLVREWYYENVAFTDFFKMPCVIGGGSFETSMREKRKKEGFDRKETIAFNNAVRKKSIEALNAVVEVLDPDFVLFGTAKGYEYYTDKELNEKFETLFENKERERKLYRLYHSGYINRQKAEDREKYLKEWAVAIKEAFILQ